MKAFIIIVSVVCVGYVLIDTIIEIILKAVGQLSNSVDFEIPVTSAGVQTNENGEIVW